MRLLVLKTTLWLSILARFPLGAAGLLLPLHAKAQGLPYSIAGLAAAGFAVGAACAPLSARLIDRFGQTGPLLATATVSATALTVAGALPDGTPAAFIILAGLAGLAQPPVAACARAIWVRRAAPHELAAMLSLEASLQEVVFVAAPLAYVAIGATWGYGIAMAACGATILTTTWIFAFSADARGMAGTVAARAGMRLGPLHTRGVQVVVLRGLTMGIAFGLIEVALIAFAREHGAPNAVGVLYGVWGLGSLLAGLIVTVRPSSVPPATRLPRLILGMSISTACLAAAPGLWSLVPLLMLAGAFIAPLIAVFNQLVGRLAPEGMLTEAYAWQMTGVYVGIAVGSAGAGGLLGVVDARVVFVSAGLVCLLPAGVVRWGRDVL